MRLPVWVEVPLSRATPIALENRSNILKSCGLNDDISPATPTVIDPIIRIHVDFMEEEAYTRYRSMMMDTEQRPGQYYYDIGDDRWNNFICRHRHEASICKCRLPVYHIGQDEAVFKQYALPSKCWTVNGKIKLRPKSEGQGVMVSAVVDEWRGFGLQITSEETDLVNRIREERSLQSRSAPRAKLIAGESPGLIFFQYGNGRGKEGYWDGIKFQEQCTDMLDVIEILYPNTQILLKVDHSSGHLKEQSDGLMVNAMGLRWGGKTTPKRDSVIEDGCLGVSPPIINGRHLTVGMLQRMIFEPGDPLPFNDPKAHPYDIPMNEAQIAKEMEARRKRRKNPRAQDAEVNGSNDTDLDAPYVIEGYVGKNKGILQVIYQLCIQN